MSFVIVEGNVFQLDDNGNPIAPETGAGAAALPANQGGVLQSGKRASDGKPQIVATDDSGRVKTQLDSQPLPTGAATEATLATRASEAKLTEVDNVLDTIYTRQADGSQKAIVRGGAKGTTTASDVTSASIDANTQALHVKGETSDKVIGRVKLQDGSGNTYLATVTNAGQLRVTTEGAPPPGFDQVNRSLIGDLAGTTTEDDIYTIPNGKVLVVTRCSGTAHASSSGDKATKLELYYDPNGNGTGMTLLRAAVMSNNAPEFSLAFEALGDGTRAIRLRRESMDSQTRYAPVFWDGIVEQ